MLDWYYFFLSSIHQEGYVGLDFLCVEDFLIIKSISKTIMGLFRVFFFLLLES